MTMGERIKQLRSANGFTQEMLAEKMNVSRSAIAKWEAANKNYSDWKIGIFRTKYFIRLMRF